MRVQIRARGPSAVKLRFTPSIGVSGLDYLLKTDNLASLSDKSAARTALELGNAAIKNVGTTAGTVAAGDDSRFKAVGTTAGTVAAGDDSRFKAVGTTAGTVAAGDDARIAGAFRFDTAQTLSAAQKTQKRADLGVGPQAVPFFFQGGDEATALTTTPAIRFSASFTAVAPNCICHSSYSIRSSSGLHSALAKLQILNFTDSVEVLVTGDQVLSPSGGYMGGSRLIASAGLIIGKVYQINLFMSADAISVCFPQGISIGGINF